MVGYAGSSVYKASSNDTEKMEQTKNNELVGCGLTFITV